MGPALEDEEEPELDGALVAAVDGAIDEMNKDAETDVEEGETDEESDGAATESQEL